MFEGLGNRAKLGAAAAVLLLKAALGAWAATALLTATGKGLLDSTDPSRGEKSFLGETIRTRNTGLGLLLLLLVVVTVAIVVQLIQQKPWARIAAIVLEGVAVLLAIWRLPDAVVP